MRYTRLFLKFMMMLYKNNNRKERDLEKALRRESSPLHCTKVATL